MRLAYLVPEFPSQTHAFFWREVCELERAGVRVNIVSTRRPASGSCRHSFVAEASQRTHYLFPPHLSDVFRGALRCFFKLHRVAAYVMSLKESDLLERMKVATMACCSLDFLEFAQRMEIEHVHVHSCAQSAHVVAMAYLLGGPRFSLHLHGDLPVYGKDHASKMRYATFVAAAARPMELQVVETVGVPAERTCTCWMGVETDRIVPPESRESGSALRVTTVARLNRAKGHEFVLRAITKVIQEGLDVRYTIVGSGPAETEIKRMVSELGLTDRLEFTGTLGESEVLSVLHRSDVFVLASLGPGEASPVAVMEAMSTGMPVICSRIGGTPQMISDGIDGYLVERKDVDGIAAHLRSLGSSAELRQRVGCAARLRAVSAFDVRRTAAHLLKQIKEHESSIIG